MGKESESYLRLLAALREAIRPMDSFEDLQIEELAFLHVRLARVYKTDWRVAPKLFKKLDEALDADSSVQSLDIFNFGNGAAVNRKDLAPELILRYESNIMRQISRIMDQLKQWRTIRPNGPKPPTPMPAPDEG